MQHSTNKGLGITNGLVKGRNLYERRTAWNINKDDLHIYYERKDQKIQL